MRTLPELLAHDLVAGKNPEFLALAAEAQAELRPEGFLELRIAAEIVRAAWCLDQMAAQDDSAFSDDLREARARYRDRLNTGFRRNTMELRRLQTDRHLNNRWNLGLPAAASAREILRFEKTNPIPVPESEIRKSEPISDTPLQTQIDTPQTAEARLHAEIEAEERRQLAEFAQRTTQIPRNAPCPCKSGEKYKRCCGKDAPPVLYQAA